MEIASKSLYKKKQVTYMFFVDVSRFVVSGRVSYNNRKVCRCILGCQVDRETIIPVFIKKPQNLFNYGISQYNQNSACRMSFSVSQVPEWVFHYRNIWNAVETQLFEKLTTEFIKGEDKYIHVKLKTWKEGNKMNFQSQDVPFDMFCNATTVLKTDSVHKQSKNYHPWYMLNTLMQKARNVAC